MTRSDRPSPQALAVDELEWMARLVAGATTPGTLEAVTFGFGENRRVEAVLRRGEWFFSLKGRGRGKPPGLNQERLKEHYQAALRELQMLRKQLRAGESPPAILMDPQSRWVRKLSFRSSPFRLRGVPVWLKQVMDDQHAELLHLRKKEAKELAVSLPDGDELRIPLRDLPWDAKPRPIPITAFDSEPEVVFEGESIELKWNGFIKGDFVPSSIAYGILRVYHAQPVLSMPGGKRLLGLESVKRIVSSQHEARRSS